jgi:hypothetical protein
MAKFEIGGEALNLPPMNFRALRAHRTEFRPALTRLRDAFNAMKADKAAADAETPPREPNPALIDATLETIETVYEARLKVIAAHLGRPLEDFTAKIRGQQELHGLTKPFDEWMAESGFESAGPQDSPLAPKAEGTAASAPA